MSKILISGGTGFIGANLIHKLIKTKNEIHVLVRTKSDLWRIKDIQKRVNIHKVDLLEIKKLKFTVKPEVAKRCSRVRNRAHPLSSQ